MNIYTYYEDIGFKEQEQLIDFWKKSWRSRGFTPIVLTKTDAEKHPYYNDFVRSLSDIHLNILNKPISSYGLSCFLRWLAYSTISNKNQFVLTSDYDVINMCVDIIEFEYRYSDDKINFYSNRCPCFVSGTPAQFEEFCYMFVEISSQNIEESKELAKKLNLEFSYHDNEFTIFHEKKLESKIRFSKDEIIVGFDGVKDYTGKLVHFSHHSIKNFLQGNRPVNQDIIRLNVIKDCCIASGLKYLYNNEDIVKELVDLEKQRLENDKYEADIEECIKAEMETFFPEDYKRIYGED